MTTGHYICRVKRKIHRTDILNSGSEIMFLKGYEATGIKEITDSVSIPKGSFYNHFTSKEEFGIEVIERYCNKGAEMFRKTLSNTNQSPITRFDTLFSNIINMYSNNISCEMGCMMSNFSAEMAGKNKQFQKVLDTGFKQWEGIMKTCLDQAIEEGELSKNTDSKLLASFLLNAWHGAIVRMKATGNTHPLQDFKKTIFNTILKNN